MKFFATPTGNPDAYYEPNSFGGAVQSPEFAEPPLRVEGAAGRWNHRDGNDDYSQAGALYRLLDPAHQARLAANIAASMSGVPAFIVERQLAHFDRADRGYGDRVRAALRKAGVEFR